LHKHNSKVNYKRNAKLLEPFKAGNFDISQLSDRKWKPAMIIIDHKLFALDKVHFTFEKDRA
jgi:hypothetical protein